MKSVALHNLGCKVNSYEIEVMQQMLQEKGYTIVPFDETADIYIVNTCTVTNIADRKSRQMLHRAKQKVVDLAKIVARYTGPIYLHVINFTDIQLYIYEKCPHEELTIIMRRYMMRIAEQIAKETECLGLITGESIGQVASQTMNSLIATNEVCELPVYRPLIGFDKQEIVEVSEKIGTYETSILPYEDCCTIFVAKHPVTKPNVKVIRRHEHNLDEKIDELVKTALETKELIIAEA